MTEHAVFQALQVMHVIAGVIVLAESLNKLERSAPFAPGLTPHQRTVDGLKALAWLLLALGAGGAAGAPLLLALGVPATAGRQWAHLTEPTLAETVVLAGFAVLIIRTRIKEG